MITLNLSSYFPPSKTLCWKVDGCLMPAMPMKFNSWNVPCWSMNASKKCGPQFNKSSNSHLQQLIDHFLTKQLNFPFTTPTRIAPEQHSHWYSGRTNTYLENNLARVSEQATIAKIYDTSKVQNRQCSCTVLYWYFVFVCKIHVPTISMVCPCLLIL